VTLLRPPRFLAPGHGSTLMTKVIAVGTRAALGKMEPWFPNPKPILTQTRLRLTLYFKRLPNCTVDEDA
jgi:hypothetical protein